MVEVNLRSFLSEFNASKFLVYISFLIFSILLAFYLDGFVQSRLFIVFLPLWFGSFLVFLGFLTGLVSFVSFPPPRTDLSSRNDFFAMCFQTLEHILLAMFQLLVYYKLEHLDDTEFVQLTWLLVFTPLFVQCFMAMVVSAWCIRHDKQFEFETFFSVNVIQFVFLAFKLDGGIQWSWTTVFIPTWVLFSLFLMGSFYSMIISIFLRRTLHVSHATRRAQLLSGTCHFLLSIPLLLFFLLLVSKLDSQKWTRQPSSSTTASRLPYIVIGLPLFMSLSFLTLLSFGSKAGNVWWFAIRKPICNFMFDLFPSLQQYANTSYKFGSESSTADQNRRQPNRAAETVRMLRVEDSRTVVEVGNAKRQKSSSLRLNNVWSNNSIESPD